MNDNKKYFTPARTVLLTGAGFTHSFGGYLASEMWAAILNQLEIRENEKLRRHMLEELNYETLYDEVLASGAYKDQEKHALTEGIRRAYKQMDEFIFQQGDRKKRSHASRVFQSFICRFAGSAKDRTRGFFFTLNQDLFVERFYTAGDPLIKIPGVHHPKWFNGQLGSTLEEGDRVLLPEENTVEKVKSNFWDKSLERFAYIKLHGSYGWKAKNGTDRMVNGHAKTEIIKKEPLLQWHLSLFEDVLREPERNLVVIGYGFGDKHINDVIAAAIRDHGLKLFVVSPKQPRDFREMLSPVNAVVERVRPRGDELWQGLFGYYRGSGTDLYQEDGLQLKPLGQLLMRDLKLI
jgi:hypothetical protein